MRSDYTSIILTTIGMGYVIWFNYEMAESFQNQYLKQLSSEGSETINFTHETKHKIVAIGIGIIGFILGIKSLQSNNRMGIIGITLSIFLIALSLLPIWTYLITDSASDVNFQ